MSHGFRSCYITDRTQFSGDEPARRRRLLEKIAEASRWGVDWIHLREKDLSTRDLEELAAQAVNAIRGQTLETLNGPPETRNPGCKTCLLINSRTDVALAVGADGVHLRANDVSVRVVNHLVYLAQARSLKQESRNFIVGVSCHSSADVTQAAAADADFAVFAPVFEKKDSPQIRPAGLEALRQACQHKIPVLALGGVTLENAQACLDVGAAGIAAIRLFQENDIHQVLNTLRGL